MPVTAASNRPAPDADLSRAETWKRSRRVDLLEAADRAIRRTGPATSMDDIASEAGISRVVLYRYFGDKSGLYRAVAESYVGDLMVQLRHALKRTTDPQRRLRRTIETYVRFIEDNEEIYDFLMHRVVREGPGAQITVAAFMRSVADEIGEVLSGDMLALGFDPAPAAIWSNGVVGMVHVATDGWMRTREVSRSRFVDYLEGLLSYGFFGLASDAVLAKKSGLARVDRPPR